MAHLLSHHRRVSNEVDGDETGTEHTGLFSINMNARCGILQVMLRLDKAGDAIEHLGDPLKREGSVVFAGRIWCLPKTGFVIVTSLFRAMRHVVRCC